MCSVLKCIVLFTFGEKKEGKKMRRKMRLADAGFFGRAWQAVLPCAVHWGVAILLWDRGVCTTLEQVLDRLGHALQHTMHQRRLTTRPCNSVRALRAQFSDRL